MDSLLDLASLAAQCAYFLFFGAALWSEYRVKTLAALRGACQHYWTAAALAALVVVIHLAAIPYDGWALALVNGGTLAACIWCAVLTDRKRDRMVIQEMQRDLGGDR